jgi:hypothetical protein
MGCGREIVALGASMSKFAIVVAGDGDVYRRNAQDKVIAVTPNNGSHFVTLKMIEGFLTQGTSRPPAKLMRSGSRRCARARSLPRA